MTASDPQNEKTYRHPWLGVEVRHLAMLSAVARTSSFRQAASDLGYVQSAVSQQVARLEHLVGGRLVERQRGQGGIRLTRLGELLAYRGDRILGELRAARIDLSLAADGVGGAIRLAVAQDVALVLARVLAAMSDDLPSLPIRVTEVIDDEQLVRLLHGGAVDVAIGGSLAAPGLASVTLLQDPFVLLTLPDSPIARMQCVSQASELAGERLIVPTAARAPTHLRSPGLVLERALRVPLAAAVPPLVAKGHGIGLVPRSVAERAATGLACVSTVGLIAPQRRSLAWHSARRRTARLELFCDAAMEAFVDGGLSDVVCAR
jgi:molybdate transport repressor ModE-like protein